MKQLVSYIKMHIRQLNKPLSEWLTKHLNADATDLSEFFGREVQTSSAPIKSMPSFISRLSTHLLPLALFYTYAPQTLRQELTDMLIASPELINTNELADPELRMDNELIRLLTDYRTAWPIIAALQEQGVNKLIPLFHDADEQALKSLERITNSSDLKTLINTFLAKNNNDLDAIDRNGLIQFLRQPDLTRWLNEYLECFKCESSNIMSLVLLALVFSCTQEESEKLVELKAFLADYPFSIHMETLLTIIYFYSGVLKKEPLASVNKTFISLLHFLTIRMSAAEQSQLIDELDQETLLLIVAQCLSGCVSVEMRFRQICHEVLYLLCSEIVLSDRAGFEAIKNRLGQPDADLFDTPELFTLAQEFLADLKESRAAGFEGAWIGSLLTSPQFVAASSAKVLKQLTDRFLLLSHTLNQEEYCYLISSQTINFSDYEDIQQSWDRINYPGMNLSETKEYWLNKKNRFIEFISSRVNQWFLIQLEERCEELKSRDLSTAERALKILYDYYCQTLPSLRGDLWFRALEYAYGSHAIPTQERWQRAKEVLLYDFKGEPIGFINESNHAITLVEDEFVLLTSAGTALIDEPLYNEQGVIIGYLSASGQMKNADPAPKNTSIQLLTQGSQKNLEQSSAGLELLLQEVFVTESLEELYAADHSPERLRWLDKQISSFVRNLEHDISSATVNVLVTHHSIESLFLLLATLKHSGNAICLFHGILTQEQTRDALFKGVYQADVHSFLDKQGAVTCFADIMMSFYKQPWFSELLSLFAVYGKKQKQEGLLCDAFNVLANGANKEEFEAVLVNLLKSETALRVLLHEFFNDDLQLPIQQLRSPAIDKLAQYFSRRHLIIALQELNKIPDWEGCLLYRTILYLLETQHNSYFPSQSTSFSTNDSWKSNELNDLSGFISRHLSKKCAIDTDFAIGYRVLGELIFRSGLAGQTALFYSGKTFNSSIARLSFTRSYLERLVDKFWIPEGIKEHFVDTVSRIRAWSDEHSPLKKELQSHHILSDWRHLVHQTWQEINKKKLPAICAYLLSYSGDKRPLACLLRDYFKTFERSPEYLHPVVKLLEQFPQRDVSAVLFDVLEIMLIKNPLLLDSVILYHMAHYYAVTNQQEDIKFPLGEINLLTYFGQNKHYFLVQRGCEELAKSCDNLTLKKRVLKGAREAQVEGFLSSKSERIYFPLMKILKRFWHYGVHTKPHSSGIVLFCDEVSSQTGRKRAAEQVNAPVLSGKVSNSYLGFAEKHKQLLSLLATIKHSSAPSSLIVKPSQISQSLFQEAVPGKLPVQETTVAKEQAVVNI